MVHTVVDGTFRQTNLTNESPEYLARREELRLAEIELMRQRERVAELRRHLPEGAPVQDYQFGEGPRDLNGSDAPVRAVRLSELFTRPNRSLVIYHFMFGKKQTKAFPMCTAWLDGVNGIADHLAQNLDFAVVAAADLPTLRAYARQRGWDKLRLLSAGNNTFDPAMLARMEPVIRRGMTADAAFLAWVMLTASRHGPRGTWDLVVGGDDDECLEYLRRLALVPATLCHCESFAIAEIDGQPVSALATCRFAEGGWAAVGQAMARVQSDLGWSAADLEASRARLAPVLACMPADAGADWCIEFVATLPQYRRRGLVDALMRQAIQLGIDHQCSLAQIQILIGNNPAQKAYEKAGFTVLDERRSSEFQAVMCSPGFRRLLRKL